MNHERRIGGEPAILAQDLLTRYLNPRALPILLKEQTFVQGVRKQMLSLPDSADHHVLNGLLSEVIRAESEVDRRDGALVLLGQLPFKRMDKQDVVSNYLLAVEKQATKDDNDPLGNPYSLLQAGEILAPYIPNTLESIRAVYQAHDALLKMYHDHPQQDLLVQAAASVTKRLKRINHAERIDLETSLFHQNVSLDEIAERVFMPRWGVIRDLRSVGIDVVIQPLQAEVEEKPRKPGHQKRREIACSLFYDQDTPPEIIAQILKVSQRTVLRYLQVPGHPKIWARSRDREARKDEAIQRFRKGEQVLDMVDDLGVVAETVRQYLREAQLTPSGEQHGGKQLIRVSPEERAARGQKEATLVFSGTDIATVVAQSGKARSVVYRDLSLAGLDLKALRQQQYAAMCRKAKFLYTQVGLPVEAVATQMGKSGMTIRRYLAAEGIILDRRQRMPTRVKS